MFKTPKKKTSQIQVVKFFNGFWILKQISWWYFSLSHLSVNFFSQDFLFGAYASEAGVQEN